MYFEVCEVQEDFDEEMNMCQYEVGIWDIGGAMDTLKGPSQFVTIKVEGLVDNRKVMALIDEEPHINSQTKNS